MAAPKAVTSAIEQKSLLRDTNASIPISNQAFIIRSMVLSDTSILAEHNRRAYWLSPLNDFLSPRASDHPEQLTRIFREGIRRRYCKPNSLSLVACPKDKPQFPIGFAQFSRLGDDEGARRWVADKGVLLRLYLFIMIWIFWAYDAVDNWAFPDSISDFKNIATFGTWIAQEDEKYWKPYPERKNRWQCHFLVVSPDYQRKGAGKLLMAEVLNKAQEERVPCGLTASKHGELLYRKLGFEYLGDFCNRIEVEKDNDGGGIMCWWPEGWDARGRSVGDDGPVTLF